MGFPEDLYKEMDTQEQMNLIRKRYTEEDLELDLKFMIPAIFKFACQVSYWHGVSVSRHCYKNKKEEKKTCISELETKYNRLAFSWNTWYSCTDLHVFSVTDRWNPDRDAFFWDPFLINEGYGFFRVWGQQEPRWRYAYPEWEVHIAEKIDEILLRTLPGINQYTTIRFCKICNRSRFCKSIGKKWICEKCRNVYTLPAQTDRIAEKKKDVGERAKMSLKLRYAILERDGFVCKICGRGPLNNDNVKLHIDHIVPISKGGKTTENNLQALCNECNLGKSDKMPLQVKLFKNDKD